MISRKFLLQAILAAIFFTSCEDVSSRAHILGPDKALSGVIGEFQDYMLSEHKMSISAFGTGGGFDGPKYLNLGFRGVYCVNENEARVMIVDAATKLLELVNGNPDLEVFFEDAPFTVKKLHMSLFFEDKYYELFREPCVGIVSVSRNGTVSYRYKAEDQEFGYSRRDEESFDEAVAKTVRVL